MMSASRFLLLFPMLALAVTLTGCATTPARSVSHSTDPKVDFVTQIKPILHERCVMCHNRNTMPDRTSFESSALAMKGDKQGPVILPGNAAGSRMMAAISSPDFHDKAMPPVSLRVTEAEVALIRLWIDQGAVWPSGKDGEIVPEHVPLE